MVDINKDISQQSKILISHFALLVVILI